MGSKRKLFMEHRTEQIVDGVTTRHVTRLWLTGAIRREAMASIALDGETVSECIHGCGVFTSGGDGHKCKTKGEQEGGA